MWWPIPVVRKFFLSVSTTRTVRRDFYQSQKYVKHPDRLYTIHAEVDALRKLPKHKKNLLIVVIRIKDYGIRNSYPCEKCQNYIKKYNVNRIWYSPNIDPEPPRTVVERRRRGNRHVRRLRMRQNYQSGYSSDSSNSSINSE